MKSFKLKKMNRNLAILTLLLLFFIGSQAKGKSSSLVSFEKEKINLIIIPSNVFLEAYSEGTSFDFSCTRSISVYVPTEGGLVGVRFSITAATCKEADSGIASAIKGFLKEL